MQIEPLEDRSLPTGPTSWPGLVNPLLEAEPNNTLDAAQDLGTLNVTGRAEAVGAIGAAAGPADVDWYRFTLNTPATVTLQTLNRQGGSALVSVLSLYNDDAGSVDPFNPLQRRLAAQNDGTAEGDAILVRDLAAGTYYLAVTGSGNSAFHPFVADSGYAGSEGDFGLLLTATDLGLAPTDGPAVLTVEPPAGAALDRSPLAVRIALGSALNAATINFTAGSPAQTVRLRYNPTGNFGQGQDQEVSLASVLNNTTAKELELLPNAALAPGFYQVVLHGSQALHAAVLADTAGRALGQNIAHPQGSDFLAVFQITAIEAGAAADDTPGAAHDLGHLDLPQFLQFTGALGDDPFYDSSSTDPVRKFRGNDVDVYHFTIDGTVLNALATEVFAGRIGSPLTPRLSLYRFDALTAQYVLIGFNIATNNPTASTAPGVPLPLASDSFLFAGLSTGEYYLVVSGAGVAPDLSQPSHSATGGFSTGDYVLNLLVHRDTVAPQVTSVSLVEGSTLTEPPTRFTVQFDKVVNLQTGNAVYLKGSDNVEYYPRLESYENVTNLATFLMLDGLPNGAAELHLSGSRGVTDIGGNALVGNPTPGGDYVVNFTVNGPPRGSGGNPLLWLDQESNDTLATAQALGVLFRNEFASTIVIRRSFATTPVTGAADNIDYYSFAVLQTRPYVIQRSATGVPGSLNLTLRNDQGTIIFQGTVPTRTVTLTAGRTYTLSLSGWSTVTPPTGTYNLTLRLATSLEPLTPLTAGPQPALRLLLGQNPLPNPPAIDSGQSFQIAENSANSTVVGMVLASDPDAGETLTYAILAGNTNGAFAIDSVSGRLLVANSAALDFETNPAFRLTVQVTDSSFANLSASAVVTILLLDANEASGFAGAFDPAAGIWYLRGGAGAGKPDAGRFAYGGPGWLPVVGDWDGNLTTTVGMVDPTGFTDPRDAVWYLRNSNNSGTPDLTPFPYGGRHWMPLAGDWSGANRTGIGMFDPGTGTWYLRNEASDGLPDAGVFAYGGVGWIPLAGDWDGDGTTTIGVLDPSSMTWYLRNSNSAGAPDFAPFQYGGVGWKPVVGDWNGDGSSTIGVVDPEGFWYLRNRNSAGAPEVTPFPYGLGTWTPVAGNWGPPTAQHLQALSQGARAAALADSALQATVSAALARLDAADVDPSVLAGLTSVPFVATDTLASGILGSAYVGSNMVFISADAAGNGWFVDPTPLQDEEFSADGSALPDTAATGHADLLTTVLHELGHLMGLFDLDSSDHAWTLMADTLPLGFRRTDALDQIFGSGSFT